MRRMASLYNKKIKKTILRRSTATSFRRSTATSFRRSTATSFRRSIAKIAAPIATPSLNRNSARSNHDSARSIHDSARSTHKLRYEKCHNND